MLRTISVYAKFSEETYFAIRLPFGPIKRKKRGFFKNKMLSKIYITCVSNGLSSTIVYRSTNEKSNELKISVVDLDE